MPRNQKDMLMLRKDAIFSPDRQKPKTTADMSARQLRRLQEREARKKTEKGGKMA